MKAQRGKPHSLQTKLQLVLWKLIILSHSVHGSDAGPPSLHPPNVLFMQPGGKCSCCIPSLPAASSPGDLPQAKQLFQGVWHSTLETAWILEVLCKYLESPIQPFLKAETSDLDFKPLPQVSPALHVMGSMCPSISCLPNASRFILSLAPPRAFIGAQGLTSGSG